MGKIIEELTPQLEKFIRDQKIFFVGTAMEDGRINVSPKGLDSLYILNSREVLWLNLTGSGNETAAHLLKKNRMTLMFCSFDRNPLILRLYGTAETFHVRDSVFEDYNSLFPKIAGARQIFKLNIEMVQTSCGFGVPLMDFVSERETLELWAENKGEDGIIDYWKEKNTISLDGEPTGIF